MTSIDTGTHVSASVSGGAALSVSLATAALDVDIGTVLYRDRNPYEGAYEADALFREQVFATAHKTMRSDFLVHAINYTEAPNDSGVTVTIGG